MNVQANAFAAADMMADVRNMNVVEIDRTWAPATSRASSDILASSFIYAGIKHIGAGCVLRWRAQITEEC